MIGDEFFMKMAFQEANLAFEEGEIPVGAVITCHNRVISKAHNQTEQLNDVTAHAEMLAFTSAAEALGAKYLTDCILYVTLEPCVMCAGAAFWTQISKIVYATPDPKRGFLKQGDLLHPKTIVEQGPFASESEMLLKKFFASRR